MNVFDSDGKLTESISYEGYQRNQMFIDELKYFLQNMQGNQVPLVTVREAAQSRRIALATKESMQKGMVLDLIEL